VIESGAQPRSRTLSVLSEYRGGLTQERSGGGTFPFWRAPAVTRDPRAGAADLPTSTETVRRPYADGMLAQHSREQLRWLRPRARAPSAASTLRQRRASPSAGARRGIARHLDDAGDQCVPSDLARNVVIGGENTGSATPSSPTVAHHQGLRQPLARQGRGTTATSCAAWRI